MSFSGCSGPYLSSRARFFHDLSLLISAHFGEIRRTNLLHLERSICTQSVYLRAVWSYGGLQLRRPMDPQPLSIRLAKAIRTGLWTTYIEMHDQVGDSSLVRCGR